MTKARFWVTHDYGYLAPITVAFNFIEVKNAPFPWVACDKDLNLYYNPDAQIESESDIPVMLLHESLHVLMDHFKRAENYKGQDQRLINFAEDMEINDNFQALVALVKKIGGVIADDFGFQRDRTFEEYYKLLQEKQQEQQQNGSGSGSEKGQGRQSDGSVPNIPDNHDCGSCTGGGPREYEKDPQIQKQQNHRTQAEVQAIIKETAERILEHNKLAGNLPGGLVLTAKKIVDRPVPWYQAMPTIIRGSLATKIGNRVDYSNKFKERNEIFIRKQREPEPKLVIMCDTSGSMQGKVSNKGTTLDYAYSKIHEVSRQMGVRTVVLSGDTFVQARSSSEKPVLKGGGGTCMDVLIEYADKNFHNSVMVLLTDGYTDYPKQKPKNPLVVGIIGEPEQKGPDYAKTIHIPVREREMEGR
jgi:predicted metal-dependent peptidase